MMIRKHSDRSIIWSSYFTPQLLVILTLGFFSGLPLALTASTLAAWLSEAKVDKAAIGLFAAVAMPYTLKFFWAPVIDSLHVPVLSKSLGRRRGWLAVVQCLLIVTTIFMALARPDINPWATAGAAFLLAFLSASQDIVIDTYRVERLKPEEQGEGAAMTQLGYRLGMLASGAGALHLASVMGWQATYLFMAGIMGAGLVLTLFMKEPALRVGGDELRTFAEWLQEFVIGPFSDFMKHQSWLLIFVFIIAYKLGDAFIGLMTNPFLLEIGFSKDQIAAIVKVYGTVATLIGTFIGGSLTLRFGVMRVLFASGILHALTNLMFVLQAQVGADVSLLAVSISVENLTGGISAAAFVAYLSSLCNVHYTGTQYALLSSLAALGRTLLATPSGLAAKLLGWEGFFMLGAIMALPGLMVLWVLRKRVTL